MKLLIATDLSQGSQSTIGAVNKRPWPAGSEACVLHVVDLAPFPLGAELLETARQGAESGVKSASECLGSSGLKIKTEVLLDYPRRAISEYARKWGADLVLVGSRGSSSLTRFLLGSVAQGVLRTAPCSVEIVRASIEDPSHARRGLKMLLATDGSDCSITAARSIAKCPWPAGSCVRVISVVPAFFPIADVATGYIYVQQDVLPDETIEKAAWSRAAKAIAQADELLRESSSVTIERSTPLFGDPKAVILDEAAKWGAHMIVVGSQGWRGFDRLMMGSVSESVALHAHCSVEVIRP